MSDTSVGVSRPRLVSALLIVIASGALGGLFWLDLMHVAAASLKRPPPTRPVVYLVAGAVLSFLAWRVASVWLARGGKNDASRLAAKPFLLTFALALGFVHHLFSGLVNTQIFLTFLFVAVLAGMAAWMAALAEPRAVGGLGARWPSPRRWLAGFCVAHVLIFALISFARYDRLLCGLYDLGIFDYLNWHAIHGQFFRHPKEAVYDHCSPILLVCLPFYFVWSHPKVLLLLQSVLFAAAAIPLFALARDRLKSERIALLFAAVYLLYPFVARINLYDFHSAPFLPLPFFGACYFLSRGKLVPYFICVLLSLSVQENVPVAIFGLGLFAAFRLGRPKTAVATMLLAVGWLAFAFKVWFPVILKAHFIHAGRYPPLLGDSFPATLQNVAKAALNSFTRYYVIATIILILLPVGFLPLFDPKTFLALTSLPIVEQMLSAYTAQRILRGHYAMSIIVVTLASSVFAFERVTHEASAQRAKCLVTWLLACALLSNLFFGEPPFETYHQDAIRYDPAKHFRLFSVSLSPRDYLMTRHHRLLHEFRGLIPPEASVMAQNNLGAVFAQREEIQFITHPFSSDFCLFDPTTNYGADDPKVYQQALDGLASGAQYTCFFKQDGFRFFAKGDAWREV
ncbi:MAG: DUF2079 domain-containing protein, partial [Planctomycetes bacterium]|nr:DUF2079 domain-containing protein [Planctomycetota bacterium]